MSYIELPRFVSLEIRRSSSAWSAEQVTSVTVAPRLPLQATAEPVSGRPGLASVAPDFCGLHLCRLTTAGHCRHTRGCIRTAAVLVYHTSPAAFIDAAAGPTLLTPRLKPTPL